MDVNGRTACSLRYAWCLALAALAASPAHTDAQALTGTVIVVVSDGQKLPIEGATVTLTSPDRPDVQRTTDARGQARFQALVPGIYGVEVAKDGFARFNDSAIPLGASATLEIRPVLEPGVTDTVVVSPGSRLEARGSGIEARYGRQFLETSPSRRLWFDAIRFAPGISPTSPSSTTDHNVAAFGSATNENVFQLDGLQGTCTCSGVARIEPSFGVIDEVQVSSIGISPEFGNFQGAVFNIVTKSGGNLFAGDVSYYGQPAALTSQPITLAVPGAGSSSGYERRHYRDATTSVGGPVLRDRAWFFTSYQYLRDADSQPGVDPRFPRTYEQDRIFAKVTWQPAPDWNVMHSFHEEFWTSPQSPTRARPFEVTLRPNATVPMITLAHVTHTLSSTTVWEARVGRYTHTRHDDPSSGDFTRSHRLDRSTGLESGNAPRIGRLRLERTTAKAILNQHIAGPRHVTQELRVGMEFERGEHDQPQAIPGGERFVDDNAQPFQRISAAPSTSGGRFLSTSAFITDAITIGRATVQAGVRFDHNRAISQDLDAMDTFGNKTGGIIEGLGTLYTQNLFSPRFGVAARLTPDGRTMLRASAGRFQQGVLTGEISPLHPGLSATTTTEFDPVTGGYTRPISIVDPRLNLLIDREMRAPRTDEYAVVLERELGASFVASGAYIHKRGTNFIAWTDVGGQYGASTLALPDGSSIPVWNFSHPRPSADSS